MQVFAGNVERVPWKTNSCAKSWGRRVLLLVWNYRRLVWLKHNREGRNGIRLRARGGKQATEGLFHWKTFGLSWVKWKSSRRFWAQWNVDLNFERIQNRQKEKQRNQSGSYCNFQAINLNFTGNAFWKNQSSHFCFTIEDRKLRGKILTHASTLYYPLLL